MKFLGILFVLLALTIPVLAQSAGDLRQSDQVPASGQPRDADANLSACQLGWAKCNHASLSPSEAAKVAVTDHRRNVSNCREGLKPCDPSKLSDAERTALAVADHQNNVAAGNDGIRSCDNSGSLPPSARGGRRRTQSQPLRLQGERGALQLLPIYGG